MNYSRRVAAWLSALPVVLVAALCGRLSRLEMISFWLLCWKLLRATSGRKRIKDREESCDSPHGAHFALQHTPHTSHTPHTHQEQQQQQPSFSFPVAMETSHLASLTAYPAEPEDCGSDDESYTAGRGAGEEVESSGNGPIVEEVGRDEEEEGEMSRDKPIVEEGGKAEEEEWLGKTRQGDLNLTERLGSASVFGEREEEEGEEEPPSPCTVKDLLSEDFMDECFPIFTAVAGGGEGRAASVLGLRLGEEASSTTSACGDPFDDLNDCLQVEMAVVSSDSDAEDQWRGYGTTGCTKREEKSKDLRDDVERPENPTLASQLLISSSPPMSCRNLVPPEGEEDGRAGSLASVPDHIPLENRSENAVEPERLDFLGVRQHWLQMEQEVKGQMAKGKLRLPQPGGIRAGFHGGHSVLCTPVRNVERSPRREAEGGEGFLAATFSPCSEDSGVEELSGRPPYEELENPVEREIRLTMEREENFRRERNQAAHRARASPSTLHPHHHPGEHDRRRLTPGSSPRLPPTFSISPSSLSSSSSSSPRRVYHEMLASNVIILEPGDSYPGSPRHRPHGPPLLSPAPPRRGFTEWPASDVPNVIILETSNLIIRSASEFCLSSSMGAGPGGAIGETVVESTFDSNPFFKLKSRSSVSLVEQEIKAVRQREEDWKRQRAQLQIGGTGATVRERYDTVLVSPSSLLEGFSYERTDVPMRCVSSPSSPSRTRKMDRSALSCDQKFPSSLSSVSSSSSTTATPRRQNAMAQRWEAGLITNHNQD